MQTHNCGIRRAVAPAHQSAMPQPIFRAADNLAARTVVKLLFEFRWID
jgi:hypothetical protein